MKSTKTFIFIVLIASIHIPWPTFGQGSEARVVQNGKLTQFSGEPDVVEVQDLRGDKMTIEANGGSMFISIFNSMTAQEIKPTPSKRRQIPE